MSEAVAWGIWHRNGDLVGLKRTKEEAEAWCGTSTTYGPPRPLYTHPAPAPSGAVLSATDLAYVFARRLVTDGVDLSRPVKLTHEMVERAMLGVVKSYRDTTHPAPAPSEAVRKFSAAHTRAMSELEFTHGVGVRGDAPSEAVPEDERCEVCVERRATIHLEGAVNELCAECHIERLERVVNGPVGETRRLLASFIQRVGDNCRLDADGYCQGHFLERGDECTVKRARDLLATHPAPARGVTEEQAADVLFWMASAARNGKPLAPILTAALTPDTEGGA